MTTDSYIVEEIRATTWSVRLRDPESGKIIDVPLESGGSWTPPGTSKTEHAANSRPERKPVEREKQERTGKSERTEPEGKVEVTKDMRTNASRKPRSEKRAHRGKAPASKPARTAEPAPPPIPTPNDPLESPTNADTWAKLQANLRHVRSRRGGKMGGLGWEETTDAGRSGLIARSGKGAYKILHAAGDTYALFYEWDNGQYEHLACGNAENLIDLATERSGPPEAPPSALSLELARVRCGNVAGDPSPAQPPAPADPDTQPPERRTRLDLRPAHRRRAGPGRAARRGRRGPRRPKG